MRLIDADALEKRMCCQCNDECSGEPCEPDECFVLGVLRDAPTIEPEPVRRGRWNVQEDDFYTGLTVITCSECGGEWCFEDICDVEQLNYRCCPGCGARMEIGGQNDLT